MSRPPPPLCEDDLLLEKEYSTSVTSISPSPAAAAGASTAAPSPAAAAAAAPAAASSSSTLASNNKKKSEELNHHHTIGISPSQRHFARLCAILADPAVDMETIRATLRRGVPDELRMDFWLLVLGVTPLDPSKRDKVMQGLVKDYQNILDAVCDDIKDGGMMDPNKKDRFPIDLDVPRTMPTLHFFASSSSPMSSPVKRKDNPSPVFPEQADEKSEQSSKIASSSATASSPADANGGDGGERGGAGGAGMQRDNSEFSSGSVAAIQNFTHTQLSLRRVLFLFSRVHCNNYAQGMNDCAGLLLWAASNGRREAVAESEAPAFFAMQSLIQWIGDHFSSSSPQNDEGIDMSGIANTLKTYSHLLRVCDPEIAEHIETKLQLVPEFYAFRWISILFSLEFPVADLLALWDYLLSFAEQVSVAAMFVAVAMIVHVREQILQMDMSAAISLLQQYPSIDIADLIATADALINRYTVHPHLWAAAAGEGTRVSGSGASANLLLVGPGGIPVVAARTEQVDSDAEEEGVSTRLKNAKDAAVKWLSEKFN